MKKNIYSAGFYLTLNRFVLPYLPNNPTLLATCLYQVVGEEILMLLHNPHSETNEKILRHHKLPDYRLQGFYAHSLSGGKDSFYLYKQKFYHSILSGLHCIFHNIVYSFLNHLFNYLGDVGKTIGFIQALFHQILQFLFGWISIFWINWIIITIYNLGVRFF